MKAFHLFFLLPFITLFLNVSNLPAQNCWYWSVPQTVSDSVTDNHNATLVMVGNNPPMYYVFWERSFEDTWSEIVCANYYDTADPQVIIHANAFDVSNPQVISVSSYSEPDTLAFVFYLYSYMEGYQDIFYTVMTDTGFTGSTRFTNTTLNESHLRVSPGGGMVWQEGDKIQFSRLKWNNSGFYFEPVVTIDEGECRNPDIQNTDLYNSTEGFIAWEKGDPDNPEIWYSQWDFGMEQWSGPMLLFDDGFHSGIRFSIGTDIASWVPMLLSDLTDESGQYRISGYDFSDQNEFVSEFTQAVPFQPGLLTIDFWTDYWATGYLVFRHDEGDGNTDIFSSDYGALEQSLEYYCRVDSNSRPDVNPGLFQGAWHFSYFDMICIWETWRNGHWQLISSIQPVYIGSVPEGDQHGNLKARAYPNPFNDLFWVEYESNGNAAVRMTIFNTFGQPVKTINTGSSQGKTLKEIDMSDFPPGIYLVKIEAGSSTVSLKLVNK